MTSSTLMIRTLAAAAALWGAGAPLAHAGACTPFADKRLVFLMRGEVHGADGVSQPGAVYIGRLMFDAGGQTGSFSMMRNQGEPVQALREEGTLSCAATRQLGGLAQQLTLSNGVKLLALRERGAVQLLLNQSLTTIAGEARPAASWGELPQGACSLVQGRIYTSRSGGADIDTSTDAVSQWRFDITPGVVEGWVAASDRAPSAQTYSIGTCATWAPDLSGLVALQNGAFGVAALYPAADGSVAWAQTVAGAPVGGWLKPR